MITGVNVILEFILPLKSLILEILESISMQDGLEMKSFLDMIGIFVGIVLKYLTVLGSILIIPVVGKVLGDVVDSVLGCGVILKNAIGIVGVIVIIVIIVSFWT